MWNLFVAYWTVGALAGGGILFAAFSAPFWVAGVRLLQSSFGGFLTNARLEIGPRKWKLSTDLAVLKDGAWLLLVVSSPAGPVLFRGAGAPLDAASRSCCIPA